jgi:hypothetical protein
MKDAMLPAIICDVLLVDMDIFGSSRALAPKTEIIDNRNENLAASVLFTPK